MSEVGERGVLFSAKISAGSFQQVVFSTGGEMIGEGWVARFEERKELLRTTPFVLQDVVHSDIQGGLLPRSIQIL